MNARRPRGAGRRRGVVLILILAMLGLLALIGVTFATFSGQAQIGARYYAEAVNTPDSEQVIDFALEQLINDSNNPKSAIRGHSLKRDMYGNDAYQNVLLRQLPEPLGYPMIVTAVIPPGSPGNATAVPLYVTNIPANSNTLIKSVPSLYDANFTGCVLRLQQWVLDAGTNAPLRQVRRPDRLTQTFEIAGDDATGTFHVFALTTADTVTTATTSPPSTAQAFVQFATLAPPPAQYPIASTETIANIFEIDGRYMGAFNGTGLGGTPTATALDGQSQSPGAPNLRLSPFSAYPNFLYNLLNSANYPSGFNDPNRIGITMDEDYDAPDNENWFLALRSADSQVNIPSFHRPGNIIYNPAVASQNDWTSTSAAAHAKFLRPRKIDHPNSGDTFPDLIPDTAQYLADGVTPNPNYGRITYDVDNDGDGVTDAVWLDLGYPVQRDASGKMYKPLFAFTVLGLNGRLALNTAGNLNRRALDGSALTAGPDHASHIGYSVNEVNPEYALAPTGQIAPLNGQGYLQVLLQGNPGNPSATPPVPPTEGRFGEIGVIRASLGAAFPRAGRSFLPNGAYSSTTYPKQDVFDTDFNGFDFYPTMNSDPTNQTNNPEVGDLLDAANRQLLPSERFRRFISPIDITGNGRMMDFGKTPFIAVGATDPSRSLDWGLGSDNRGRISHFLYFRPPGISNWPGDTNNLPDLPDINNLATNTINKLHGYEAFRNPIEDNRNVMSPMPYDMNGGMKLPTFTSQINANSLADYTDPTTVLGIYPGGSFALNDAAQLNLYEKTPYDSPFGLADQEWLNRVGDVDSSGLATRLASLMPDILLNDGNAALKRNLLAIEHWDLNTWSAPSYTMGTGFRYPNATTTKFAGVGARPALMHGGKRINLNLPLPVSNYPDEPVRQKWCRDTYQALKCILYPPFGTTRADGNPVTAEELAAIGQFVVNIVDFRDPDATMTKFVNYDLELDSPPTTTTLTAGDPTIPENPPTGGGNVPIIAVPAGVHLSPAAGTTTPLIQWGMEYNPIAITEVLGYQFTRKDPADSTNKVTPRLFIELVNTLTRDYGTTGTGNATYQDMNGWGFVITQDNPSSTATESAVERPNRITGQLDPATIAKYFVPLAGGGMGPTATPAPLTNKVDSLDKGGNPPEDYYIFGNYIGGTAPSGTPKGYANVEQNTPDIDSQLPDEVVKQIPMTTLPVTTSTADAKAEYYWVHLLRPANPNATDMAAEEKVVVDSFRFPYFRDGGTAKKVDANNDSLTQGLNAIYSTRRLQPYRGGHFIPRSETYSAPNPYGYTEQTFPTQNQDGTYNVDPATNKTTAGVYPQNVSGSPTLKLITGKIYHSLSKRNSTAENWDIFPFLDRDFQSVAELTLVPACPPGLFTKQFVEHPNAQPYDVNTTGAKPVPAGTLPPTNSQLRRADKDYMKYYYAPPFAATSEVGQPSDPLTIPSTPLADSADPSKSKPPTSSQFSFSGGPSQVEDPAAFPYLPEAFFYSYGTKSRWHKMLEFFEVPSTSFGYIGPVAAGQNADWARRDLRPGLMNLNLIVDEEVFFGLIDDPRLNDQPAFVNRTLAYYPADNVANTPGGYNLPSPTTTTTMPIGVSGYPRYATAIYPNGIPSAAMTTVPVTFDTSTTPATVVSDRGYITARNSIKTAISSDMKAAFSDFLKLRDGGSGLVYSPFSTSSYAAIWGDPTNQAGLIAMPSRPFRSLAGAPLLDTGSPPDINDTVLRPARLPSFQGYSGHTDQALRFDSIKNPIVLNPSLPAAEKPKQPEYLPATPRIAPRRLFQIPDADSVTVLANLQSVTGADPTKGANPTWDTATEFIAPIFDPNVKTKTSGTLTWNWPAGEPNWSSQDHVFLSNPNPSLFQNTSDLDATTMTPNPPHQGYLGGSTYDSTVDRRWHPLYRTEMLSKVMNQTTVRTHQYAVWLTVGFFEVVKEGNPQLFNQYDPTTNVSLAVDQLGRELNAEAGRNVRYRSYFLIDRTRATGFNPQEPGDFRDLIVFRRRIE